MLKPRARRVLVAVGIALAVVGVGTWFLPLAISAKPALSETVEITKGHAKTTKESLGWGVVHSDQIFIAFVASGLILALFGALPRGAIKKISIFGTEIELGLDELKTVVASATAKAPQGKAPSEIVGGALEELGAVGEASTGKFAPSRTQLEAAVDRTIEREAKNS